MPKPTPCHGATDRAEMVAFIPAGARRILDVGCSAGLFGQALRRSGHRAQLTGVEPDPVAAARAATVYDEVIAGRFPECVGERTFDCIVMNDVLEHMEDPWAAVAAAAALLADDGRIVASIPNVRYIAVLVRLALLGRWDYAESGILDVSHLRFFTRSSIEELFAGEGLAIERLEPINPLVRPGARLLLWGPLRDTRFMNFAVVARPGRRSAPGS